MLASAAWLAENPRLWYRWRTSPSPCVAGQHLWAFWTVHLSNLVSCCSCFDGSVCVSKAVVRLSNLLFHRQEPAGCRLWRVKPASRCGVLLLPSQNPFSRGRRLRARTDAHLFTGMRRSPSANLSQPLGSPRLGPGFRSERQQYSSLRCICCREPILFVFRGQKQKFYSCLASCLIFEGILNLIALRRMIRGG